MSLPSLLFAAAITLLLLAAVTLVPFPTAVVNDLGYYSLCPFAPWSTLALLLAAGLSWALSRHIAAQQR